MARVARGEVRRSGGAELVGAARAAGLTGGQILTRHLLPNAAPVFIVQLSWSMAAAVLAEAGLSFLGFGAPVTQPSWGLLLSELQSYVALHPPSVVWPGLAITLPVLSLHLLGHAPRDAPEVGSASRRGRV